MASLDGTGAVMSNCVIPWPVHLCYAWWCTIYERQPFLVMLLVCATCKDHRFMPCCFGLVQPSLCSLAGLFGFGALLVVKVRTLELVLSLVHSWQSMC